MSYTYGQLKQTHPEYMSDEWSELDDLYCGGFQMQRRSQKYLPRMLGEMHERYEERVRTCASYINYFGQVVDAFAANVFSQELSVTPAPDAADASTPGKEPEKPEFYKEFERDADLCGTPFVKLIRSVFTCCLVKKRALLGVDFPGDVQAEPDAHVPIPSSRAEEEALGKDRAYVYEIPIESLVDWEMSGPGHFKWAVLRKDIQEATGPGASRAKIVTEFKVWELEGDGDLKKAAWSTWQTDPYDPSNPPKDDFRLHKKAGGTTSFNRIPLMLMEVEDGLWIGNRIGSMAMEHFRRRSMLNSAQLRSLFIIPYVTLGEEYSAPGYSVSDVQTNPNRADGGPLEAFQRKGYQLLGKDDAIKFAEPAGHVYEIIDKQLENLANEIFRVVHQMASSVALAGHSGFRSGRSKVEDRHDMEIVLSAYGSLVRGFVKQLYDFISQARGDKTLWAPHGMDTYELEDRNLLIKEAAFVDSFGIPSRTFRIAHKTKIAFALVGNVPTETKQTIRDEITKGVPEEEAHEDLQEKMEERMLQDNIDAPPGAHAPAAPGDTGGGGGPLAPADAKTHHPHRIIRQKNGQVGGNKKPPMPTGKMSMPLKP